MARRTNPIQPIIDKLPAPVKNKYFIVLVVFLFILFFVNRVNPLIQWELGQTLEELEDKKKYYEQKLEEVETDRADNEKNIEKYAREHYYMKKADEDVFIIVEEEDPFREK